MSTDAGSPIPPRRPPSRDLPPIRQIRIRRVPWDAPELEHFRSSLAKHKEAIEFMVETEGPVPVRAYGPALFVGDVEVNQSECVGERTWRLLAYEPKRLIPGAPISWGWMKDPPAARQATTFRYEAEGRSHPSR